MGLHHHPQMEAILVLVLVECPRVLCWWKKMFRRRRRTRNHLGVYLEAVEANLQRVGREGEQQVSGDLMWQFLTKNRAKKG
jgi:hypothetical protein